MIYLLLWLLFGFFSAWIAASKSSPERKGSAGCLWFFLGVVFGPFALVAVFVIPSEKEPDSQIKTSGPDLVDCPACGKPGVSRKAEACPNCGHPIEDEAIEDNQTKRDERKKNVQRLRKLLNPRAGLIFIALTIFVLTPFFLSYIDYGEGNEESEKISCSEISDAKTISSLQRMLRNKGHEIKQDGEWGAETESVLRDECGRSFVIVTKNDLVNTEEDQSD